MKALLFTILSRGLLILVLLAAGAGYYYRAALFPGVFGEPASVAEQSSEDAPADVAGAEPVAQPSVPADEQPVTATEPSAAVEAPQTGQAPGGEVTPGNAGMMPSEQPPTVAVTASEPPPVAEPPSVPLSGEGVQWPEPPTAAAPTATDDAAEATQETAAEGAASVAASVSDVPDTRTALERARNAYWAGNVKDALVAYQEAVAENPGDPDAQGELGNLHFAEGNWQGAADAYLAAGEALLGRGDVNAADHLVVVLEGLDPEHAKRLREAIDAQRSDKR
jgi:hypothetical protein